MSELREVTILCEICKGKKIIPEEMRCDCKRLTERLRWVYYVTDPNCKKCGGSGKKTMNLCCYNCQGTGIRKIWVES